MKIDLLNPPSPFQQFYMEHEREMQCDALFFPYLVSHSIGKECVFNPYKEEIKDKVYKILNHFGYGELQGCFEGSIAKKRMYQYVCEYYKYYKEQENNA